ncbi:phage terminase small subunit P27 family [Priestia aryabhattai]|uniref:phage terminase small subunit P27 family n=1 Tax=Priestia TaxID=2800373 RepID=UPI00234F7439|nr:MULTISPECIES: phage terminase small subunit P27 family [Priestia]MDC7762664.1 phage terminase small subunit P27 family [Priestia aryabhattai]MED3980880.1 phage terminase small subunit P27 family [Priestia megaterium]
MNYSVGRPRKPAFLKKGRSETKAELAERAEQENKLMGATDKLDIVPQYLDPLAQAYYKYLVKELEISGLLTNLDIPLLEQTADSLSKLRQCDDIINADGVLISTFDRNGNEIVKEHPTVKTKMAYLNAFKTLSIQLGMSPSARAQLAGMQIEKKEEETDPLLQLLKEHS